MEKVPMTAEGYRALDDQLKQLKSVERPSVIAAISEAREHGDDAGQPRQLAVRDGDAAADSRAEHRLALLDQLGVGEPVEHPARHDAERVGRGLDGVAGGEGKLLEIENEKIAAYRDEQNKLHVVSSVCPHMGCIVHFNKTEKSWDCPCHGSHYDTSGRIRKGPAPSNLAVPNYEYVSDTLIKISL